MGERGRARDEVRAADALLTLLHGPGRAHQDRVTQLWADSRLGGTAAQRGASGDRARVMAEGLLAQLAGGGAGPAT